METVDGERMTMARFGRRLPMVRVASYEAPILGMAPVVAVMIGGPPPSNNSVRVASVW
jgi:hypothetical protein